LIGTMCQAIVVVETSLSEGATEVVNAGKAATLLVDARDRLLVSSVRKHRRRTKRDFVSQAYLHSRTRLPLLPRGPSNISSSAEHVRSARR